MKKVLVIAYYFPPLGLSGVQRTLKFVKYLPYFGWEPIVVTTNAPAYYAYDDSLLNDFNNEIKIYRTEEDITKYAKKSGERTTVKYPSKFKQKLFRILSQSVFQPDSRILWKKYAINACEKAIRENEVDAIYATAPPFTDFLVAKEIADKYNIPFIVDYRDLWIDNAFYFYLTPFHKLYSSNLESEVLKYASKTVVITRFMKEKLIQRYSEVSHKDIIIIPHGFDREDFDVNKELINKDKNKFVVSHSGLFPDDLTPEYFFKALEQFTQNKEIKKNIAVNFYGLMKDEHINLAKQYNLQDIINFHGYIPHNEIIIKLLESDILWFMITNNIATPSRMFEYIGSKKPFIASCPEGNIREIAKESKVAYITEPKDNAEIYNGLNYFYQKWKQNKLPIIADNFAEKYDRKLLTEILAKELELLS